MNLDGLRRAAERAIHRPERIEREDAVYALAGKLDLIARRHYVRLSSVNISRHLQPGETVELHRSLLPPDEPSYTQVPGRKFDWSLWTALQIEHIGDCVRVLVPKYGRLSIPCGDFVRAVMQGNVRAPVNTPPDPGVEAGSP